MLGTESPAGQEESGWVIFTLTGSVSVLGTRTCAEQGARALFPPEQDSGEGEGRVPKMTGETMYLQAPVQCKLKT